MKLTNMNIGDAIARQLSEIDELTLSVHDEIFKKVTQKALIRLIRD